MSRYDGYSADIRLVSNERNLGFAGGANVGIRAADADVVVVMNPDVTVRPDTLSTLAEALLADPQAAIAGCKLLFPDGKTIQHAGGHLDGVLALGTHYGYGEIDRGQYDQPREVEYVTGALFAVKKSALERIGYFDEGFFPAYFEETDLCRRARDAGYRVLYVPRAVAIHHESATTGKNTPSYYHLFHRNRLRFVLKHYSPRQIERDFLAAELSRMRQLPSLVELAALRQAYADNIAVLENRADFFANPAAVQPLPKHEGNLKALRTLESQVGDLIERGGGAAARRQQRAELVHSSDQLAEPEFESDAPIVSPVVVAVRRVWNWMSTKWYVRQVIEHQNAINARFADSISAASRSAEGAEKSVRESREELGALDDRVAELERELREARAELQRLGALLDERSVASKHRATDREAAE